MEITREIVEKSVKKKGWVWFSGSKDYDLNIVGIRNMTKKVTNKFDDFITVSYKLGGVWKFHIFPATTDPGNFYMKNPLRKEGTAILKSGQYRGSHQLGLHQGKYQALTQKIPLPVFRDKDKDSEYDLIPESIQTGIFGINIHRSNPYTESELVDKWSAGCQVFKRVKDFNLFMGLCRKSSKIWGNSFTYTLIDIDELDTPKKS